MANRDVLDGIAVFASSYVKRLLETHYDALMRTAPARKLMEQGAPTRYGIEAALYALVAYADQHWSPDTPLRRLVREVALDTPAELSKRLVNGFRDEVMASRGSDKSNQTRSIEQTLLQLDDATLGPLLAWLARTTPQDHDRFRSLIPTLSDEELQKFARLGPEDLDALMSCSEHSEARAKDASGPLADMAATVQRARERVQSRLRRNSEEGGDDR